MVRVFANVPGDLGSIPGRVIPKNQKMVLDASLLNTRHYKARIKRKVEQSRELRSAPPLHLGVVAVEKGAFGSPSTTVANFTYLYTKKRVHLQNSSWSVLNFGDGDAESLLLSLLWPTLTSRLKKGIK